MKTKLLTIFCTCIMTFSYAQFTTGVVNLTGSTRTIRIDTNATTVVMTLTGNSTHWLGVGFNGFSMSEVTDMFIFNSTTNLDYVAPGGHFIPSADAVQSWTIVSNTVVSGVRTLVVSRPLVSAGDYTFLNDNSSINIIFSEGSTTTLAYHGNNPHAPQTLTRTALGVESFSLQSSKIYPNPSKGEFTIKTNTKLSQINIYSELGKLIKSISVEDDLNTNEVSVNGLSTGIYFLELQNDTEKSWKKVVVE